MREFHNTVYKGNLRIVYIEEILLSCKLSDWKGRCTTYVYITNNPDSYKSNIFVQLAVILHVASQMASRRMKLLHAPAVTGSSSNNSERARQP
jgi:hypothetical protein